MLLYYVRHGEPIYNPDSLTENGKEQAVALSRRLARHGLDEIYASTSNRARQTAQPTAEALGREVTLLDFANEGHAWRALSFEENGRRLWPFQSHATRKRFSEPDVTAAGLDWYKLPDLAWCEEGVTRIAREADAFLSSLGYEHIVGTGSYRVREKNERRVALFAHQGFGMVFLSHLLDIPYPAFCVRFDLLHSGLTVIRFHEEDGLAFPKVLTLSNDAHLYEGDVPLSYYEPF